MLKKILSLLLISSYAIAKTTACHPTLALNDPNGIDEDKFVTVLKDSIPPEQSGRDTEELIAGDRNLIERRDDIVFRGAFRTSCEYSHFSFNDPIVYPGIKGGAHLHMFMGNTGTNHDSTPESIEKYGNSTCAGGILNRTSYWVPAFLNKDGAVQVPDKTVIYYKAYAPEELHEKVEPFPKNMAMISRRAIYRCAAEPKGTEYKSIPSCIGSRQMTVFITFPRCWDPNKGLGWDLKGEGHVDYRNAANCPDDHVFLPKLVFRFNFYKDREESFLGWHVASDTKEDLANDQGGISLHADWVNGWKSEIIETWVKQCNHSFLNCRVDNLGDGTKLAPYTPDTL